MTYRSNKCIVTQEELEGEIRIKHKNDETSSKAIKVRTVNLNGIMDDKLKFIGLTKILNATQNQSIFITEFVV